MRTRYSVGTFWENSSRFWRFGILLSLIWVALYRSAATSAQSRHNGSGGEREDAERPVKADADAGKPIFERHCAPCHGISGSGGRGPRLNRNYLPHAPDDIELRSVITNGIPPGMPDASYLSDDEVANLAAHIRSLAKQPGEIVTGNPNRGAALYARFGCSACHMQSGKGVGFGPDLTHIGEARSATFVKGILNNPAAELPDGFLMVSAVTTDGQTVVGIRLNEDTFSIQIKDRAGHIFSFRKSELRSLQRRTGQTPMPSFAKLLSPQELDDLVSFLISPRPAR
jgi:cytochrome c oxidase cbb3-type subunit 3